MFTTLACKNMLPWIVGARFVHSVNVAEQGVSLKQSYNFIFAEMFTTNTLPQGRDRVCSFCQGTGRRSVLLFENLRSRHYCKTQLDPEA